MELIIGISITVISFIIITLLTYISKQVGKGNRKQRLVEIKVEGIVHAMQQHSGNGFSKHYESYIEQKIKDDEFINS